MERIFIDNDSRDARRFVGCFMALWAVAALLTLIATVVGIWGFIQVVQWLTTK